MNQIYFTWTCTCGQTAKKPQRKRWKAILHGKRHNEQVHNETEIITVERTA